MSLSMTMKSFLPPLDLGWNRTREECALPACHNKLLMRAVPGSRVGIYVGERWFCSPDCFAVGCRNTLWTLSAGSVTEMPRNPRLPLGLAMLAKGFISEEQLRTATTLSERRGETLEATLIEQGFASEKQVAAARGAQWGIPVLAQEPSSQVVHADLPLTLLDACGTAPLHYSAKARRLVLGFVDRVDYPLLHAIEQITGLRAEPCFITPSEFDAQMSRVKSFPDYQEIVEEEPGNEAQMSRTLGGFAVELSATAAAFARCKGWIWARISGDRGIADVIFAVKSTAAGASRKFSSVMPKVTGAAAR
jgi:hypothetical protein